jgi:NitT/TauT family transport system substrate-binding protein
MSSFISNTRDGKMKKIIGLLLVVSLAASLCAGCSKKTESIGMAVEFMDHAACAYIAEEKGWFEEEGLNLSAYESYASGMALAAAIARGDIEVAYLCLVPAISAYANANVPIKIIAGTHKYGYGLVVNPEVIQTVQDMETPGLRIGCVQEGGAVDVVLQKTIDVNGLDREKVMANIQRMSPQKMALAIRTGQLDGAFMPEHWATLGEEFGFVMMLTSQDVWPEMQGSVLVVKESLLNERPEAAGKLVNVSVRATDWIHNNPLDAAETVARQLNSTQTDLPADMMSDLAVTPEVIYRSMERLDFTEEIDIEQIQATIDYMAELGYISSSFPAEDILDLRFIE